MAVESSKQKPGIRGVIKWIVVLVVGLLIAAIMFLVIAGAVTYSANHIRTEHGIEEGIYVPLGGQEQYLLIRGEDTANPIIIWLHGGPAGPDAYANYVFQKYLIEDYTVVNWDQRGCGRTYFRNREEDPQNTTATFAQAQADLDELVDYLRERFSQEQVILVGHSYGTMLGSRYVLDHPEKIAAYIGVGQVVSLESDLYSYEDALQKAKAKGDDTSAMVAAYEKYKQDKSLTNLMDLRKVVNKYHVPDRSANTIWMGAVSPYMGMDDLRWFFKQAGDFEAYVKLNKQLFDYIMYTDVREYGLDYQVPVGFITGAQDWTTPVSYARTYCESIDAPSKQFIIIEGCGHAPQFDAPEEFGTVLKTMLAEYIK